MKPVIPHVEGDINFLVNVQHLQYHFYQQINQLFHTYESRSPLHSIDFVANDLYEISLHYTDQAFIFDELPIYLDTEGRFAINHRIREMVYDIYHTDLENYLKEAGYCDHLSHTAYDILAPALSQLTIHLLFQILLAVYHQLHQFAQNNEDWLLIGTSMLPFYQQIQSVTITSIPRQNVGDAIASVSFHDD